MTITGRPQPGEYPPFSQGYVERVPDGNIVQILRAQHAALLDRLTPLSAAQLQFRPTPADWNALEVLGHITDGEQVFAYRALRIARGDATPLPGFEQDDYVRAARDAERPLAELLAVYSAVRAVSLARFASFDSAAWQRRGTASGYPCSARAWAYICAGHELHHLADFQERYGF